MGCWNKTCGLTNLPIMASEKTYVFLLERVNKVYDHCYATHLYRPLLLPFVSTYDDYGGGEQSQGVAFTTILAGMREHLVEMPQGDNEYHDVAVTRNAWCEELFFRAVHEHRLKINHPDDGVTDVEFVMMRKDVVDDLLDSYEFEEYVGEGKGTQGWRHSYTSYRFGDLVESVPELLDATMQLMQEQNWKWPRLDMVVSKFQEREGERNLAAKWLRSDLSYKYSGIVQVRDLIVSLLVKGERDLARDLMIEHLRGMFVNTFMEITRKSWIPGGHEGSQRQEYEPYCALITAMTRVMAARDAEYAEDDDGADD
jgi:hypothetical protein